MSLNIAYDCNKLPVATVYARTLALLCHTLYHAGQPLHTQHKCGEILPQCSHLRVLGLVLSQAGFHSPEGLAQTVGLNA
jgi:hypothetical protein